MIESEAALWDIVNEIGYKSGWGWRIGTKGDNFWLQSAFMRPDADTGKWGLGFGRKWLISPHMTKSEVVQTALLAIIQNEEHEARENFRYKGERIFGPHFDVEERVQFCKTAREDVRA